MGYRRFEELPVWQDAIELAARVFAWTGGGPLNGLSGLKDQIERAVVSISNNIAEGFERGTNQELLTFLYYAKGSAGEVRSMLHLLDRIERLNSDQLLVDDLRGRCESISRQLGRWIESIKDSGFQGTRSRDSQARQQSQSTERRDAFLAELRRIQDGAKKSDPPGEPGS